MRTNAKYNHDDVVFFSDPHAWHGNIIKYCNRPYLAEIDKEALRRDGVWHDGDWKGERSSKWRMSDEAIHMMNEALITNINSVTTPRTEVWCLGDILFAPKNDKNLVEYFRRCKSFVERIRCNSFNVVWGNHDSHCLPFWDCENLPKKEHDKLCVGSLFTLSYDKAAISVKGQYIVLDHYCNAIWDKSHRGVWHLYGHSHSGAEPWLDKYMPGRRSFDVGVDNAKKVLGEYRPFKFSEVVRIMSSRQGFSMDHHVPTNSNNPTEEELQ